jgi:hypothetical protein
VEERILLSCAAKRASPALPDSQTLSNNWNSDDERRMANSEWRIANGEWQKERAASGER